MVATAYAALSAATSHREWWFCVMVFMCVLNGMRFYERFLAGELKETHHDHREVVPATSCRRSAATLGGYVCMCVCVCVWT